MDLQEPVAHCYCDILVIEPYMLQCQLCKRYYHPGCLKIGRPSSLVGDMFFKFICSNCTGTGREVCERLRIQWMQVLLLTMYNLQLEGGGKLGYFRWREHICGFIDRHWTLFFGTSRKKTTTWHGTIAGALSGGANTLFRSGTAELGESGWWALMSPLPPTVPEIENLIASHRANRRSKNSACETSPKVEGLRHRGHKNAMQAAIELKEKRSTLQESKRKGIHQMWIPEGEPSTSSAVKVEACETTPFDPLSVIDWPSSSSYNSLVKNDEEAEVNIDVGSIVSPIKIKEEPLDIDDTFMDVTTSIESNSEIKQEQQNPLQGSFDQKFDSDEEYLEVDVDPYATPLPLQSNLPDMEDIMGAVGNENQKCSLDMSETSNEDVEEVAIKKEPKDLYDAFHSNSPDGNDKESDENSSDSSDIQTVDAIQSSSRKRKATIKEEPVETEIEQPKCMQMSVYEERLLLKKLGSLSDAVENNPKARRLRRKLIVRQIKRERNLPVFDFDAEIEHVCHLSPKDSGMAKRKNRKPENMLKAVKAVREKKMGYKTAVKLFNLPRATLKDYVKSALSAEECVTQKFGRKLTLSPEVEKILVQYCLEMENSYYGLTLSDLLHMAYELAIRNNLPHPFNKESRKAGLKWKRLFFKRHPELTLRNPQTLSMARIQGFTKENVSKFFSILKLELEKVNFDKTRVFNVDETGLSVIQHKTIKVVTTKGKQNVHRLSSADREATVTVVTCMSASGQYVPPMMIFPLERWEPELLDGAPPGTIGGVSDSGWITGPLFSKWLENFISLVRPSKERPVVLVLDGHFSHTRNIQVIDRARETGISVVCLPPNSTNKLQPLDVALMFPLRTYYAQAIENWLANHPGCVVRTLQIPSLFAEAYIKAATMETAVSGFKKTGIIPFNPNIFLDSHFVAQVPVIEPSYLNRCDSASLVTGACT